ncbi:MAG: xanthine dehydrogenase family protein molybdopterin-binding subunit [Acidimicrobiia bacterium]|nr:xanthine dehydrogenase family protein molybdopterin-binding subunit [Acidimicrobiia bacterium]
MTDTVAPDEATPAPAGAGVGAGQAFMGAALLRKEDPRLISGQGRYVDDIVLPRMLHMTVVRATQVGRIRSIDTAAARARPGVHAVLTGEDLAEHFENPLPCAWPVTEDIKVPPHWPLTRDVARFVGDGLAVVVAEDRATATDAMEDVEVDYDPLPAVTDLMAALAEDAPVVHEELGTNRSYEWPLSTGDVAGEGPVGWRLDVLGERPGAGKRVLEVLGQVVAGEDGVHARPGAGGGGADASDAPHLGGPHDGQVQHPGQDDVVDVAALAADEAGVLLAQEGCAHEGLAGADGVTRLGRGGGLGGGGAGHRGLPSSTST